MNLRQFIYRQIAKRQPARAKVYRNFNDVKSILIIFESDYIERNTFIKNALAKLKEDGKNAEAWGYVDKNDSTTSTIAPFRIICNNDISKLTHIPKKESLSEMLSQHYDLLIDLRTKPCIPMQYMTLYANADLKAGADIEDAESCKVRPLDFMVKLPQTDDENPEPDPQTLFNEIIYYIRTIK